MVWPAHYVLLGPKGQRPTYRLAARYPGEQMATTPAPESLSHVSLPCRDFCREFQGADKLPHDRWGG